MTIRIDAHQHFWNVQRIQYPILSPEVFGELYRTIEPSELDPIRRKLDIDQTIAVQAKDGVDESEYLLELADRHDWIAGIVGWVDLAQPELAQAQLRTFAQHPKFLGVRHLIMVDSDPDWLIRPSVMEGLQLLAEYDLPFEVGAEFPLHLKHVASIARRVPRLRLVIDHLAKPPRDPSNLAEWKKQMAEAASFPQVYAKVSGLQSNEALPDIIDFVFATFGADRLMFGSDWPICTFNGGYERIWQAVNEAVGSRPTRELEALFGGTAQSVYRLAER